MLPLFDNLKYKTFPWATFTLISLNIVAYICEMGLSGTGTLHSFIDHWAYANGKAQIAFASGYPDLILTAIASFFVALFTHTNFLHLATNMTFFYALGPAMEARMGRASFVCFYLIAGIISIEALSWTTPLGDQALGASGALGGLMAAYLVLWPRARLTALVPPLTPITTNAFFLLLDFIVLQVTDVWFNQHISVQGAIHVAYWAHLGGIAFGLVVAACMRLQQVIRPSKQQAKVIVPPYTRELYDYFLDWLEGGITNTWSIAHRILQSILLLPRRLRRTAAPDA